MATPLRLSELHPDEVQSVSQPGALSLSKLDPSEVHSADEPGSIESLLRGGAQGASLGFADELAGAGGAAMDAAKKMSLSDLVKDYIASRDKYRAGDAEASKAHPYLYGGGELGGGLATALIPGLGIAKGATTAARVASAAKLGGLAGLGSSNADLTQGDVGGAALDTAKGAALGGVIQGGLEGAGKLAKMGVRTLSGVPEEAIDNYLARPDAVNNAKDLTEIATERVPKVLGGLREDSGPLYEHAMQQLSNDRSLETNPELQHVLQLIPEGEATKPLRDRLEQAVRDRAGSMEPVANPSRLTQAELHDVKKTLQDLVPQWNRPTEMTESAINDIRQSSGKVNELLKGSNEGYRQGMADVAENTGLKKSVAAKMGLEASPGEPYGLKATDRTVNFLKRLGSGKSMDAQELVGHLKDLGHGDLAQEVQDAVTKASFDKTYRMGSAHRLMGALGGGAMADASGRSGSHSMFQLAGAGLGALQENYGGKAAKGLLDGKLILDKLASSPAGKKYIGPIQAAMSRGNSSVAATHFMLSQTDPGYQQAVGQSE